MGFPQKVIRMSFVFLSAVPLLAQAGGSALQRGLEEIAGSYGLAAEQPTVCLKSLLVTYNPQGPSLKAGDFHTFERINRGEATEVRDDGKYTIQDEVIFRANKLLHVRVETEREGLIAPVVVARRRRQHILRVEGSSALRTTEVASDGFVLSCVYNRHE